MRVDLLTNSDNGFLASIQKNTKESDSITFVTAFGSLEGFKLIENSFEEMMSRSGSAKFLFDISQGMTDPELIEELVTYPGESKVKICTRNKENQFLHTKMYIFEGDKNRLINGSNNFSHGGFVKNIETALLVEEPVGTLLSKAKDLAFSLWNSKNAIDPTVHPEIFEAYKKLHKKWKTRNFEKQNSTELDELYKEIRNLNSEDQYENNNLDVLYLLGALAANIGSQHKAASDNGEYTFNFRSSPQNTNNPSEKGFITTIIGKGASKERLGNIRLPQQKTMSKYVKHISDQIASFIRVHDTGAKVNYTDRSKTQVLIAISIKFDKPNKLWKIFKNYVDLCSKKATSPKLTPVLPKNLNALKPELSTNFIQGYMDFRSRISQADRVGQAGKLRIGVQVDKSATKFLYDFRDHLQNIHKFEVNVNDGTDRGKDNLIRLTASAGITDLFNSTWQKKMSGEFADYNAKHF